MQSALRIRSPPGLGMTWNSAYSPSCRAPHERGWAKNPIQHYLGHRNIQHTVRYTELAPHRFRDFWDD
jgi:integrase